MQLKSYRSERLEGQPQLEVAGYRQSNGRQETQPYGTGRLEMLGMSSVLKIILGGIFVALGFEFRASHLLGKHTY
jgi:hypothetical protein